MFKTKLQELCQSKLFPLPNYSSTRQGADHKPKFKATVIVNGVSFDSSDSCKSSKEAQNEAAKFAFLHFTLPFQRPVSSSSSNSPVSSLKGAGREQVMSPKPSVECFQRPVSSSSSVSSSTGSSSGITLMGNSPSGECTLFEKNEETSKNPHIHANASGVKDDQEFEDVQYLYKSQLLNYAQKRGLSVPVYSCVREGLPHALRFKAMVTVDGQTFECPKFCRTVRETEHAVAKIALSSLSKDGGIQEASFMSLMAFIDDSGLYKNLLQELTRKEGFSLPVYTTTRFGESHVPTFTSTVEVEGDIFHGVAAKTKKQAEIGAAKVAYFSLKERQMSRRHVSLSQSDDDAEEALECIYSSSNSASLAVDLQQKLNLQDAGQEAVSSELTNRVKDGADHSSAHLLKPGKVSEPNNNVSFSPDITYDHLQVPLQLVASPKDGSSSPTTVLEPDLYVTKQKTDLKLLCNRILVYPRKTDLKFRKDITVLPLPFSDDEWVAVRLDYPN
ncbi:hypothetical protein IFM89_027257 [Coptis chinensis]|uniref:DRBM domain-containing protein n=1 Tax=Coptis chinensis TaxID=261450 RepID=A0A835HHA6_9MAGN|nr:hypothetical protein IFM89_027257 [Coptis chinensis]